MRKLFLSTVLIFAFISCSEESTDPNATYIISGKLLHNGNPLPNATVSLNDQINLSSQSDANGAFLIKNVPKGDYSLSVNKTNPDGSFISKNSDISVNQDVFIESLILPKGVTIFNPENVGSNSMDIKWSATDANDLREYKLYRHISSGLDETTGTLVHVSTAINDTQFTDQSVNPLTTYYYRVYIMNDYGRLGGSNIVSSTTLNRNVISNGSFAEVTSNFPNNWSTWGTQGKFSSSTEFAQDGNKSLKINLNLSDWGVNSWGVYQQIDPNNFEAGQTYKISFWCKTDTLEQYESISFNFFKNNYWDGNNSLAALYDFVKGPRAESDWQYFSLTLTIPLEIPSNYGLSFMLVRAGTTGYTFHYPMISWIDNIIIEKIP